MALSAPQRFWSDRVRSNLDAMLALAPAREGPVPTAMWHAALDTRSGRPPAGRTGPKRVYRNIDAPDGISLYWDQPQIVAAHAASAVFGDPRYAAAADAYGSDFLARCVAPNGMFLWGNHYFFDVRRGANVWFVGEEDPQPCRMDEEVGRLHEARPVTPAWESLWRLSPMATERHIRLMGTEHVVDPATGCFNRHADRRASCAFLESGGILVESLAWLANRTGDAAPGELARRIARYSFAQRDRQTGLLENNPTQMRWDKHVCTTEVGLWAGSLLRAADLLGCDELASMADAAMSAYLAAGFDASTGLYYGQLRVRDAAPVRDERTTPYQPGLHAGFWNPLFPTHDYPLAFAETCVGLLRRTQAPRYREAVERWLAALRRALPANNGAGAYAEHYGRAVHFALSAADALRNPGTGALAAEIAAEAERVLWAGRMFRTHPGEDRYDAVDGVGFLLLALLRLAGHPEPNLMGFGF